MSYFGGIDYDNLSSMSHEELCALRDLIDNEKKFRGSTVNFQLYGHNRPTVVRFLETAIVLNEEREKKLEFLSRLYKKRVFS